MHLNHYLKKSHRGQGVIVGIGLLIITLCLSVLAIDTGFYWTSQNTLQSAADSASLAAADELYVNQSSVLADRYTASRNMAVTFAAKYQLNNQNIVVDPNANVTLGYVDPVTKTYNANTFSTPSSSINYIKTGGYNAVRVVASKMNGSPNGTLPTIFGPLVGIQTMQTQAVSIAMLDDTVGVVTNGLRPIYGCQAQFSSTNQDGNPGNNVVTIYGDHTEVDGVSTQAGCPTPGSGNWSFADLRNCSPDSVGTSTINDWFATGFPGSVDVGQCYSSDPGNFISAISNTLDTLIAKQTTFIIPLYNSWSGTGSNSMVNISGFAGFQITAYKAKGSQSDRYIQGKFVDISCNQGNSTQFCSTGTTETGGGVVRLRLI